MYQDEEYGYHEQLNPGQRDELESLRAIQDDEPKVNVDEQVYRRLLELAEKRGITVRLLSFDQKLARRLPSHPTKAEMRLIRNVLSGWHCEKDGRSMIYINRHLRRQSRNLTFGHELRHYLQKKRSGIDNAEYWKEGAYYRRLEADADAFSHRLVAFLQRRFSRPEKVIPPPAQLEEYRRRKSRVVNLADYRRPRPAA